MAVENPVPFYIVGHCPHCGAPIYAPYIDSRKTEIQYTCDCRLSRSKTIEERKETK